MPDNDPSLRLMLGYLCVSGDTEASLNSKVEILDRFKLADKEIATICGVSVGSVANARLALKKANGKKKK